MVLTVCVLACQSCRIDQAIWSTTWLSLWRRNSPSKLSVSCVTAEISGDLAHHHLFVPRASVSWGVSNCRTARNWSAYFSLALTSPLWDVALKKTSCQMSKGSARLEFNLILSKAKYLEKLKSTRGWIGLLCNWVFSICKGFTGFWSVPTKDAWISVVRMHKPTFFIHMVFQYYVKQRIKRAQRMLTRLSEAD